VPGIKRRHRVWQFVHQRLGQAQVAAALMRRFLPRQRDLCCDALAHLRGAQAGSPLLDSLLGGEGGGSSRLGGGDRALQSSSRRAI
jgi:hypothetical protein